MRLINTRTKKLLLSEMRICTSFWQKARGLILKEPQSLLFVYARPQRIHLHMIGVRFPIDVVLMDLEGTVLELKTLRPWQFFTSENNAQLVLETPSGPIERKEICLGDKLTTEILKPLWMS
ncbi:MAG TPA: DUF192 domain-containing protein [Candidatus Nanoarchaeia archaeon]|nr:DUF192 domain-containing protein [Candidatus Nanoarchaeia archaeon]